VFMNMINGAVLLGSPIRSNVVVGAAIGILGIVLVFWPQLAAFSLSDRTALGISTVYEGYQWHTHNIIGLAIVLIGNWMVLNKKALGLKSVIGEDNCATR